MFEIIKKTFDKINLIALNKRVTLQQEKLLQQSTQISRQKEELLERSHQLSLQQENLSKQEEEIFQLKGILSKQTEDLSYQTAQHSWHKEERFRVINKYLSLIQKCLTGTIYEDPPLSVLDAKKFDAQLREYGWDWPSVAHTMIGEKRLVNVRNLTESVLGNGVEGDFIETGVWRGGACIMIRAILEAYCVKDRHVWLADSFEGLPPPDEDRYPADKGDQFHTFPELKVSLEEVINNFEKYGLFDDQVKFLKGWFKDTLPNAPIKKLALLRLDGDMYESTMDSLTALYDKVSPKGYVIIDDYHVVAGCKQAVHDFLESRALTPEIKEIDGVGVYWQV